MVEYVLKILGAGDSLLTVMGPAVTILLAFLFGGAMAQFLKFPLSQFVTGRWHDWAVRALAFACTWAWAHFLSDKLGAALEFGTAAAQPIAYRVAIGAARKWAPWIDSKAITGSVDAVRAARTKL